MAANKNDLVGAVQELLASKEIELNKKDTTTVVDTVIDSIIGLTGEAGKLQLVGFGSFEVKERSARKGYNPKLLQELKAQGVPEEQAKAQTEIEIEASKSVGFKVGKAFKEFVK